MLESRIRKLVAAQRGFSNGAACIARVAAWRLVSKRVAMPVWKSWGGTRILTRHYGWLAALECFSYDSYRLRSLPRELRLQSFLDIGANIGSFTLAVTERWSGANGIGCEPSAELFNILRENLRLNHNTSCECLQAAVIGDAESGNVPFRYDARFPNSSNIALDPSAPKEEEYVMVPAITL